MLAQIYNQIDTAIKWVDDRIWGLPLIILILTTGIYLTVRLGGLQIRHLPKALRFMVKNEEEGHGEVTSFGALCTALSATIGTGNITGVATAIAAGGPGALFWMVVAAFFGMATKYAEGLLAIKYRTIDKEGHVLGGPFYYIENGMGKNWRWLAKIFAFFGAGVGLFGIGTFTQVNSIVRGVCSDHYDHTYYRNPGSDRNDCEICIYRKCTGRRRDGNHGRGHAERNRKGNLFQ